MFENIENIKLVDIVAQTSSIYLSRTCRDNHGFIFKLTGESQYEFTNCVFHLKEGEMLYIPKGSSYIVRRTSPCESHYVALCFDAVIEDAKPQLYQISNYLDINHICHNLERLWLFRSCADEYKCISFFYDILSKICELDKISYRSNEQYQLIEPAIEYMKAHIYDSTLRAQDLHELCGISGTYFRKIFSSRYGISPQKYIINKRLNQAYIILHDGDYESIAQVAACVGYEDALYFSRAFKAKYGIAPSRSSIINRGE